MFKDNTILMCVVVGGCLALVGFVCLMDHLRNPRPGAQLEGADYGEREDAAHMLARLGHEDYTDRFPILSTEREKLLDPDDFPPADEAITAELPVVQPSTRHLRIVWPDRELARSPR